MTIEATNLEDILKAYSALTGKGLAQITRAHARLCAVELANRTQPWTSKNSKGPDVLAKVSKTVTKDVKKVVKAKDDFESYIHGAIQDDKIKQRLLKVAKENRYDILSKIMFNCGLITSEDKLQQITGNSQHKETHIKHRDNKGRTYMPRGEKYISQNGLSTYIQQVIKRIGYTKSGWAECARRIGGLSGDGARGIPSFAKRQRGNNWNVDDNGANIDNPNFVMTNTTPWIRRLLSANDEKDAMRIARDKMIKSMQRAIKQAKRGESAAKKSIAKEVADAQ
jgi:hypothetical protein